MSSAFSRGHALVVGVARYQNFNPLPSAVTNDASDLANLLQDPNYCGYPSDQVQLLLDERATKKAIVDGLRVLASKAGPKDTVIIFFSGHGARTEGKLKNDNYLIPNDGHPEWLRASALHSEDFTSLLKEIGAQRLVVLLDACHAGGTGELKKASPDAVLKLGLDDNAYQRLASGAGRVIIASSLASEVSWARSGMRNSIFTHCLLDALRGAAYIRSDGLIHIMDVFHDLAEKVPALEPRQHPILKAQDVENNFPLAFFRGGKGWATDAARRAERSPYRGLSAFDVEDKEIFFGREELIERMLSKLRPREDPKNEGRFLSIVGGSGSGKSSLARAGLLGAFKAGALSQSTEWPQIVMTPAADPIEGLAISLSRTIFPKNTPSKVRELARQIENDRRALHIALQLGLPSVGKGKKVVFLIDQFEEIFSLTKEEQRRRAFIDNILEAAFAVHGPAIVIITMRSDFYGRCGEYPELAAALSDHQILVPTMTREELRLAITEPASLKNVSLEEGLCDTIISDVLNQPGSLPLLQHALLELWNQRTINTPTLTHRVYTAIGRVHGALAKRAEDVFDSLNLQEQKVCEQIFIRLTELGDETEDTRRRASVEELLAGSDQHQLLVNRVIERLSSADIRLITLSADEDGTDIHVEVTHEAIIKNWPRLRGWLHHNRQAIVSHRKLTEVANDWAKNGFENAYLYRGNLLAGVDSWFVIMRDHISDLEQRFLTESACIEVDTLLHCDLDSLAETASRLAGLGHFVRDRLTDIASDEGTESFARRRCYCTLMSVGFPPTDFLLNQLLLCDVQEFVILLSFLPSVSEDSAAFFQKMTRESVSREGRLRAAAALARFDTTSTTWTELSRSIAEAFTGEDEYNLPLWTQVFRPARNILIPELLNVVKDETLTVRRRGVATFVLVEWCKDDAPIMAEILSVCDSSHFDLAYRHVAAAKDLLELMAHLDKIADESVVSQTELSPVRAKRSAAAVSVLCKFGLSDRVLRHLRDATSIECTTQFIHGLRERKVEISDVLPLVLEAKHAKVKAAIALSLGEFERPDFGSALASIALDTLFEWYRLDGNCWVHGACKWLLRRWSFAGELAKEDEALSMVLASAGRQWYVRNLNGNYITFIIVEAGEYQIGSPRSEPLRQSDEALHTVRITRRFAIADSQVRRQEFNSFEDSGNPRFDGIDECAPTPKHPMIWVSWRDSIRYANWLTHQSGLQSIDQCYEETLAGSGSEGVVNFFPERRGFRLPTEAEREIACRAGTASAFSFGNDVNLLRHYGWYLDNSNLKTHEPGELRPNPWGLFDMHGNAYNWCSDRYGPYYLDSEPDPRGPSRGESRVLRGGGWNYGARDARSAHRYFSQENNRHGKIGFRLVQTLA
jgi:formylglycine-generating enzyme required for sulfatase activity